MIGYLKGEVAGIYEDRIVMEVGGIGYNIFMPASSLDLIEGIGETIKVYTYLLVREDALSLYGFLTKDDLELYKLLISVNGIGPKGGLALLSVMTSDDLRFAILSGDAKQIGKAPGIGPKTAQRLIIDLKDKVNLMDAFELKASHTAADKESDTLGAIRNEAVEALVALGYSQSDSYRAVRSVEEDSGNVESILKAALTNISKFRWKITKRASCTTSALRASVPRAAFSGHQPPTNGQSASAFLAAGNPLVSLKCASSKPKYPSGISKSSEKR